jgi:hypothetical protein
MTDPIRPNLFQRAALGLVPHTNQTKLSIVQRFLAAVPLAIIGVSAMLTEAVLGLKGYAFNAVSIMVGSDQRANKIDRVAGTIFGYIGRSRDSLNAPARYEQIKSLCESLKPEEARLSDASDSNSDTEQPFIASNERQPSPSHLNFTENQLFEVFRGDKSMKRIEGDNYFERSKDLGGDGFKTFTPITVDGQTYQIQNQVFKDLPRSNIELQRKNGELITINFITQEETQNPGQTPQKIIEKFVRIMTEELPDNTDRTRLIQNALNTINQISFANMEDPIVLGFTRDMNLGLVAKKETFKHVYSINENGSIHAQHKVSFKPLDYDDPERENSKILEMKVDYDLKGDRLSNTQYILNVNEIRS